MEVMGIEPGLTDSDWATLAATSAAALMCLALMLTGDPADAEDLLQSTFVRACRHGDRIARIVTAYNSLPGEFTIPMSSSCPAASGSPTIVHTTVAFSASSGHVWTAASLPAFCGFLPVTVSYDGQALKGPLDGGRNWAVAVR